MNYNWITYFHLSSDKIKVHASIEINSYIRTFHGKYFSVNDKLSRMAPVFPTFLLLLSFYLLFSLPFATFVFLDFFSRLSLSLFLFPSTRHCYFYNLNHDFLYISYRLIYKIPSTVVSATTLAGILLSIIGHLSQEY